MAWNPVERSGGPTERPRAIEWLMRATGAPALEAEHWRVLGLVSIATLFGQYDRAIFTLALPQIQAGLGIAEGQIGMLAAFVRLGALPAFAIALAADRLGRRGVLIGTIVAYTLMVFALLGQDALLATYGAELFPTSHRTTAAGARMLVGTGAAALGLAAESLLYGWLGSHWSAISVLLCGLLAVPIVIAAAFPETAGRTLEEIAPERPHPHARTEKEPA